MPVAERTGVVTTGVATVRIYVSSTRNGSLRRVLGAYLLYIAAEYGAWIAVTLYAYARGGATTAGLVMIAQLVPAALVAPLGSVLGDRMRRDRALRLGYLVQAAAYLVGGLALWFAPPVVAYAGAVVFASAVTLTRPVHNAILPQLSETPEQLTAANSLSGVAEGFGILLGPILASMLIAVSGPALPVTVFSGVALVAALLTGELRLLEVAGDTVGEVQPDRVVRAAVDGLRELRR